MASSSSSLPLPAMPPPGRGIYVNRTLNLRSISAIGYDMDYTLIHYKVEEWEQRAFEHIKQRLVAQGWPIDSVKFDPDSVTRGLIIDLELGNIIKANRFGYVKKALHGTHPLDFDAQRTAYARTQVDLSDNRWVFLNTLFSISEACMYQQLVDLLDARKLPEVLGYRDLYQRVRRVLDAAHMEGQLKAEIIADPSRFVSLDPDTVLALLDQRHAGKKLLLITNSEWPYTEAMMRHAFDPFMPAGQTWRELFHMVMVSAGKPEFFNARMPVFEVMTDTGLLKPFPSQFRGGAVYHGGNAALVEKHLGISGDDILYVGDHMFTDVHISKSVLRWRTALVLREIEAEVVAQRTFLADGARLMSMMRQKEKLEYRLNQLRLMQQRLRAGYGPPPAIPQPAIEPEVASLRQQLQELDVSIGPLAKKSSEVGNPIWGPLMRTGNDKSHLARQVERYADIYLSRVSNFLFETPFIFLRSQRGSLPHDDLE